MSNNDDDLDLESGLGHDPLEWLQDDEDANATVPTDVSESKTAPAPEPETTAAAAEQSEPSSPPETDNVLPEPVPLPDTDNTSEPEAPAAAAEQSQQSFRYENHKAYLTVPEKLAIQVIEPMHSEWKTLLYDLPQSIEIDAGNTKEVDTAGLQLFYSIVQQLAFKGSDVVIVAMHPALQRQITLFGLSDFFAQYQHAA
ncbi:STAS domain-containing protein [Planctobacterium marinum]|uniref:STAS domain-containing protein n=1 Tax=Planctobacterium marinum TaxID=1631968 RepID=A0AA48HUU6_9ALTE|nr:hypothetical protein MACH26_39050 [Planctobacterium marinum]